MSRVFIGGLAAGLSRLLLSERIDGFRHDLEPLAGYRTAARIRHSVGTLVDLLQRAFDVRETRRGAPRQVVVQLPDRQALSVLLVLARPAARCRVDVLFLGLLRFAGAQQFGAQSEQVAALTLEEGRWESRCLGVHASILIRMQGRVNRMPVRDSK